MKSTIYKEHYQFYFNFRSTVRGPIARLYTPHGAAQFRRERRRREIFQFGGQWPLRGVNAVAVRRTTPHGVAEIIEFRHPDTVANHAEIHTWID